MEIHQKFPERFTPEIPGEEQVQYIVPGEVHPRDPGEEQEQYILVSCFLFLV